MLTSLARRRLHLGGLHLGRVSARVPLELREEELREALGTMTGQENEREEVFDELRDRRVGKC